MRRFRMTAGESCRVPRSKRENGPVRWAKWPGRAAAPAASKKTRKVDTASWCSTRDFRVSEQRSEDNSRLPEDQARGTPRRNTLLAGQTYPPRRAASSGIIPDWLRQQFDAEPDAPQDSASAPPPPETPGRIPGVTRRLRPLDAGQPPAADQPSTAPPSATPGGIPGVTRRLQPLETLPPAGPDSPPDWLSEDVKALVAVEAGKPEPLSFDDWERQHLEREREGKRPERCSKVFPWFEQLGGASPARGRELLRDARRARAEFAPEACLENKHRKPMVPQLDFGRSRRRRELAAKTRCRLFNWRSGAPRRPSIFRRRPSRSGERRRSRADRGEEQPPPDEGDFVERLTRRGKIRQPRMAGRGAARSRNENPPTAVHACASDDSRDGKDLRRNVPDR